MAKQHTLARAAHCEGIGLHTGHLSSMAFRPAPPNTGLVFRRVDLPGTPVVPADIDHVQGTERGTTIGIGDIQVHTVEHVLAALYALEIDNCYIDVNAPEPPVDDGSSRTFATVLEAAGRVEQPAEREEYRVAEPFAWSLGPVAISVTPADELRVSYEISYEHPVIGDQGASWSVTPSTFLEEIAPARTYCFLHDVEALKAAGLIRGGSLDNAIVIGDETVLNEELRYPDEFVRHKLIDLLGDLALFGKRLRGHVSAVRAGHTAHVAFVRQLRAAARGRRNGDGGAVRPPAALTELKPAMGVAAAQRFLPMDREAIKRIIPHREPFLFVDQILELSEQRVVGAFSLREDEWFFHGHFPGMPVTPGVIIVEALAQAGGVLTRLMLPDPERIPVLLTMDDVKFRSAARPGDTLRLEVTPQRMKSKLGRLSGRAFVGDAVACEGSIVFTMVDAHTIRTAVGPGI